MFIFKRPNDEKIKDEVLENFGLMVKKFENLHSFCFFLTK